MLWPHRHRLLLVVDDAGWIVDEVGRHLAAHLPAALRARVVGRDWVSARDCTIHFINRSWAWGDGVLDRAHTSNRLLGLWWHGRIDSPELALQAALARLQRVHHWFERIQVTCVSGHDTLLALGVPEYKIVQLPEGVDTEMFRPDADGARRMQLRRRLGIPEGAIAVGCFQKDGSGWGNGSEPKLVKGPDVFVDALAALRRQYPVYAVLPGPSRGYVTRRLSALGVPHSAPGFVQRDELPWLYHALDIYVSPSRDEGGPAGVLEAMASGIPVVSTKTGMAADLIESGENGLLVPVDDSAALATAVAQLAETPAQGTSMAIRARTTIVAYDWRAVAHRYAEELYVQRGADTPSTDL